MQSTSSSLPIGYRRFFIVCAVILIHLCHFVSVLFSFPLEVVSSPQLDASLLHVTVGASKQNANPNISTWSISTEESFISSLNALKFDPYDSTGPSRKGLTAGIERRQRPIKTKRSAIDKAKTTSLDNHSIKSKKDEIGFKSSESLSYSSIIRALRAYHSIHGNLVIPRRYVIPPGSPEYPVETHNVDLAATVYNMEWWQQHVRYHTTRVAELNQIGFLWERLQPEWNLVVEALITYNALYGNLLVPSSFVVPSGIASVTSSMLDDNTRNSISTKLQWPTATWGIPLGRCVRSIRSRQDFVRGKPDRLAQLIAMGFVWDVREHQFRKCFRAIEHYAKYVSTGDIGRKKKALRIPNTFVVPSGQGWPKDLWNYPCKILLFLLFFPFVSTPNSKYPFSFYLLSALFLFYSYVVGAKCCAIRQKGLFVKNQPDRISALEEIGFQWSGNASLGWLEVVHAAAIYSQLHGRQLNVPQTFVVPCPPKAYRTNSLASPFGGMACKEETWPWPEKLWGLKLGQRLKDIRLKGRYLKGKSANARIMQLDALGFVWKPKRGPRQLPPLYALCDD